MDHTLESRGIADTIHAMNNAVRQLEEANHPGAIFTRLWQNYGLSRRLSQAQGE